MNYLYDLHGILQITSNEPLTRLTWFRVERLSSGPEIMIRFGPFTPDLRGYRQIGKCWIEDRSLYCADRHKLCFFKLWMRGIDTEATAINFDGDPLFSREIFYVLILEPYLTKKLSRFGTLLLHAASLSVNGRGYLISGLTGTGKTTLLLKLLNLPQAKYLSDDQTIVRGGEVLCYPMPIGFRGHLLRSSGVKVGALDRGAILFTDLINWATGYYGNATHRVPAENITLPSGSNIAVGDTALLHSIFLLNVCGESSIHEADPGEALPLLMDHNRRNEDKQKLLFRFFTKYKQVYPDFSYWDRYEGLIKKLGDSGTRFYLVNLRSRYAVSGVVDEIRDIIKGELV